MEARELRIGNLVKIGSSEVTVWGILGNNVVELENAVDSVTIHDLLPIPLTEEWLLKFGFEIDCENFQLLMQKARLGFVYFGNVNHFSIEQDGKLIDLAYGQIKYVHSLQNLYFALTGEELTIEN